jgi:hypothetical protein
MTDMYVARLCSTSWRRTSPDHTKRPNLSTVDTASMIHGVAHFMLEAVFIDCLARIELRLRDRVGEEEKKFIDRGNGGNQRLRERG